MPARCPRASRCTPLALAGALCAQDPPPAGGVDLSGEQHRAIGEALGDRRRSLDDWLERFDLSGSFAARYLHTDRGGAHPEGALLVQQALLFTRAEIRDVGLVFLELRLDYFPDDDERGVGLGEAYLQLRDVAQFGGGRLDLKVGRFDLPFGEWYLLEDPDKNRMVGFPAVIPYRWDEGVQAIAAFDGFGANLAVTQGTFSRNSQTGVAPAVTGRVHWEPHRDLYLSASGHYVDGADTTALCFGGSVITPVTGAATGSSPSLEVRTLLGSLDLKWQATEQVFVQASAGGGRVDDAVDAFDRQFGWWMLEPSWRWSTAWMVAARWSGVGTFSADEGYQFESRPYAAGGASYGFDLASLQRVAVAVSHQFHPNLVGKFEVGFDHLSATDVSGRGDDTRRFLGLELAVTF